MTHFRRVRLPKNCLDIYACGDWHIGDLFYEPRALDRFVKYLYKHPPGVVLLMGDLGRFFPYSDKLNRADETAQSAFPTPAEQLEEIERVIGSIPKQHAVFLLHGNHENHLFRESGSLYADMAKRLGIQYVGYQAALLFTWPKPCQYPLRVLATHGHKSVPFQHSFDPALMERHRANARIALRRMLTKIDGAASDLYFMGHTHRVLSAPPPTTMQLYNNGKEFIAREVYVAEVTHPVWCYNTGSCTKSFPPKTTTYQEEAMFGASDMAFVHVPLGRKDHRPLPEAKTEVALLS